MVPPLLEVLFDGLGAGRKDGMPLNPDAVSPTTMVEDGAIEI